MSSPELKPFQRKGVRKIAHFLGRALLGDDMGLGKTCQALKYCEEYLDSDQPIIVVCPKTVKEHWRREAIKFCGMRSTILEHMKPPKKKPIVRTGRFYIINYEVLGKVTKKSGTWLRWLKKLRPQCVIIDEAHRIKNPQANCTKAVRELCFGVKHVIALTGTPILSRHVELFPIANLLRPDVFPAFMPYAIKYCGARRTPWGWDFRTSTRGKELNKKLLQTCMIRRRKEDVLDDLPAKTRTVVRVKMDKVREYRQAESEFIKWLMRKSRRRALRAAKAKELVKLGYLKRLAAELKVKSIFEWIDNFLASTDQKLIVFGVHKVVLKQILARYAKQAVLVTGEVTGRKRQAAIDRFNNDKSVRVFVGNIHAAGIGWSCTSASTILFVELDWVPGNHKQAEDRVHGIGRGTGKGVNIYYLVAVGTIEEKICQILEGKQGVLDRALDGKKQLKALDLHRQLESLYLQAA